MTYSKGKIVKGVVSGIEPYGIFVKLDDDYNGLIHISEISTGFVSNPGRFAQIGETIYVEIINIDEENLKLNLIIKNINYRVGKYNRRVQVKETKSGFSTLEQRLPVWIKENIENHKKELNSIDK